MPNNKIYIAGRNQTKTVTPSNIQQTVSPDAGYNALDSVVVNPIKAAMPQTLEQFVMRDDNIEPFSLSLDGAVPDYACYQQNKLVAVYGTPTSIGAQAFNRCLNLEEISSHSIISTGADSLAFCYLLKKADFRSVTSIGNSTFQDCRTLQYIDIRSATSLGTGTFYNCISLILIDITGAHNATLASTNAIPDNINLVILVANDNDKAHYQSATNWSAHASKIKTVAEYEQQIGMSYDDYYEIIFGHPRFDNQEAAS